MVVHPGHRLPAPRGRRPWSAGRPATQPDALAVMAAALPELVTTRDQGSNTQSPPRATSYHTTGR
jgi:hypothetical protein